MGILAIAIILVVAIVGLYVYEPSPAEGFAFSSEGKTVQLSDGRTLADVDCGDPEGRPVFYFHGGPGSRLEGLLFDDLSRESGIRLIALDRPGYGLSTPKKDRSYLDWANDVSELADHLGIDRFGVLGWSSGGPYAAVVAHQLPERVTVAAIVAGEGPYANDDYPQSVLTEDSFAASGMNKLFIWSANNGPWAMQTLFRVQRIVLFRDPAGMMESAGDYGLPAKDVQFFTRDISAEYGAEQVEAFRQGAQGITRDFTIERIDWPFDLEEIHGPTVLVFHGEEDTSVDPRISEYVCSRIPSCDEPTMYPGEGHSAIYYRYEEIIQAMLEAWK